MASIYIEARSKLITHCLIITKQYKCVNDYCKLLEKLLVKYKPFGFNSYTLLQTS
jgi:hypothetical protein